MTARQLSKRVKFWRDFLLPLGLYHWTVHVDIVDEVENEYQIFANASCSSSTHYDRVWLEFRRGWLEAVETTEEDIDRVIVHELVHAAMRDFDHAIHTVNDYLGEPHKSAWQDEVNHAREGLVERLALSLIRAASADVVR